VQLPLVQKQEQNSNANGHAPVPQESLLKNDSCRDLSGLKVLVVDDEADSLELIKTFLEHCGAHVMTANSVDDALSHFNGTAPDVLISDIGMPKTDGYEFIKKVRQFPSEKGGEIPAVALTAYARSEDKTRALRSGFQTHLSKPIEMDELIRAIATVAGRK
jgi:CheY-like chemotaxis protein